MSETKNLKLFKHNEPLETNENQFNIKKALHDNWDKLDEFAGKVNDKVIEMEDNQEQHDTDLQAIKQEQQEQNSKIENNTTKNEEQTELLNQIVNILPTAKGEGEYVTLEDTAEMKFKKFEVQGNSKQETRSGKNKFDGNFSQGYDSSGKITSSNQFVCNTNLINVEQNKKYTISNNLNLKIASIAYYKDNEFVNFKSNVDLNTINIPENVNQIRFNLYREQGLSVSEINMCQLEEGEIATDYEPYGASPSPEYLSKIRNVGDNINLFDKNNANILNSAVDSNGIGTNAGDTYKTIYIPCKPNTTYTVSKLYDVAKNRFALGYTNTEPTYSMQVEGYISNANVSNLTITTGKNAKYLLAYVWITGGTSTYQEMLDSIKIEEGIQATAYSPYNCGNTEIIVNNKNLFNIDETIYNNINFPNDVKIENGNIIFRTNNSQMRLKPLKVKEDTLYTYILRLKSNVTVLNNINFTAKYTDGTEELVFASRNTDTNEFIAKFKTNADKTLDYVYARYTDGQWSTLFIEGTIILEGDHIQNNIGYIHNEQQQIVFPFTAGKRLYKGDYLAEDGIHRNIRKFIINGTETIYNATLTSSGKVLFNLNCPGVIGTSFGDSPIRFCNIFNKSEFKKWGSLTETATDGIATFTDQVKILCNNVFGIGVEDNLETRKTKISNWITQNNIILHIKIEEDITAYTPEQQEVYNKLKKLQSYNEQTNILSKDEINPIFNVEAIKNLNATFAQLSATMLERS